MNTVRLPDFKPAGDPTSGDPPTVKVGKYGRKCNANNPATYQHESPLAALILSTPTCKFETHNGLRWAEFSYNVGGPDGKPETFSIPWDNESPDIMGRVRVDLRGEDADIDKWRADISKHPLFNSKGCVMSRRDQELLIDWFSRVNGAPPIVTQKQITEWLLTLAVTEDPSLLTTEVPDSTTNPAAARESTRRIADLAAANVEDMRQIEWVSTPLAFVTSTVAVLSQAAALYGHGYMLCRETFVVLMTMLDWHCTSVNRYNIFPPTLSQAERHNLMREYFREATRVVIDSFASATGSVQNCMSAILESLTNKQQENTTNAQQ